jgi:hypothetical protein
MPFDLARHGDALERTYADWIQSRLPAYADVWNEFIGNDGQCQLPLQDRLPKDMAAKRATLAARNYTALESAIGAKRLVDTSWGIVIPPLRTRSSIDVYLDAINTLVAFYAQMGRIHDQVLALEGPFKAKGLAGGLYEFYSQRNTVLHEAKLPAAIIDGVLAIVPPAGTREEIQPVRFTGAASAHVELPGVLEWLLHELLNRLNSAFARLRADHLHPHYGRILQIVREASPPENPLATTTATTIMISGLGLNDDDQFHFRPSGTIVKS